MRPSHDIEMSAFGPKEDLWPTHSATSAHGVLAYSHDDNDRRRVPRPRTPPLRRFIDSFKRDPDRHVTPASVINPVISRKRNSMRGSDESRPPVNVPTRQHQGAHYFDVHAANVNTANTLLFRELKGRHLQMIAIGGSIGTGLFVASGKALSTGGPGSLMVAYCFVGLMLYCTIQALGELAVTFPVAGSFSAYSTRFLDPAWGFAMGWNYALQWLVVLPLEVIAASITITYWNKDLEKSILITIFLVTIIFINLLGVKGYGEAEFIFALIKITAIIGFILLGIVINIGKGGFPNDGYIGGRFWSDPGAFKNGFKGLCSVFVGAAFAFTGTELVGLAAAEAVNPRKSLPTAIKQVFWRITLFYTVSLALVSLLVPHNNPNLLGAQSNVDVHASPFVIAIESAGIAILPSVMNAVILIAVISVGNSAIFGSSRTLAALADQGQAPQILGYVDRRGRPLVAILASSLVGLLGYLADLDGQADVLDWLLAISALSIILTWGSICLSHIRFRKAWAAKGRHVRDLAFRSQVGTPGSWLGLALNFCVLVAQFWTAAFPLPPPAKVGEAVKDMDARPAQEKAKDFFLAYLCAPIVIAFYVGYKLWYQTHVVKIEEIDVDTGRRDFNLPILLAHERDERRAWPRWKRIYKFFC